MGAQWKAKPKEAAANARGKIFGRLVKEIMIAARNGADPDMNPKLRLAVHQAKSLDAQGHPGAGDQEGRRPDRRDRQLERTTYEGFAPHQVPVIVECLTDNVNRTVAEIRVLFRKGQLGASGSVAWDFDHVGLIEASSDSGADPELAAIEAGAQDFDVADDDNSLFITAPTDLDAVSRALPEQGFTVNSAHLGYRPKNPVTSLTPEQREEVEAFLEAIDGHDDVQNVYVGLAG
ncbi:YebC/PmpR family DNA-binding transcriptional regulator [Pseudomonas lalucatii]|nr:YebC/PmpR family DNA-binding transcriptional regulator [Pseudomonas lalucatii]